MVEDALSAHRRAGGDDEANRETGERESTRSQRYYRRAATLGGGLLLALVVCAVVSEDNAGGQRRELEGLGGDVAVGPDAWSNDPEVAKMEDTISDLKQSLDDSKHAVLVAKARAAKVAKIAHKYGPQGDRALREVYAHNEHYRVDKGTAAVSLAKSPAKPVVPLVNLKEMDTLKAALATLENSKLTPVHTRKMATATLSEVQDQLQNLESGVDCSRKAEYDSMLANFGDLLEQLQRDDKAREQLEKEKRTVMEQAVDEFAKVERAYNDSTTRLAAAEGNAKSAHDNFVKFKDLVESLKKEKDDVEKKLSTIGTDSEKTLSGVTTLRTYIDEMQNAIDTGAESVYAERLMSASEVAESLPIREQSKNVLRAGIKSPAKPKDMTADILNSIEEEAKSGAAGLQARLTSVSEGLDSSKKDYDRYQMDYITFSTDVDLQRDLQRAAHAELNQLDGKQMAATLSYEAWQKQYTAATETSAQVKTATEQVIAKLADGLAACTGGAAASGTVIKLAGGVRKRIAWPKAGASAEGKAAMPPLVEQDGEQLAGDPVLYHPPADLDDSSTIQGIADGKYPELHPKADESLGAQEIDEFKGAIAEADAEHASDEPGLGMPKDAQWVNSWARKLPGGMVIKPVHLSSVDKQLLALRKSSPIQAH